VVQIWVPVQETDMILLPMPGAGKAVAALHALPFHVLTVVPMVATQNVLEAQETVVMLLPKLTRGNHVPPE